MQSLQASMEPKVVDGKATRPDSVIFFVEKPLGRNADPIVANIVYHFIGRADLPWENNGKDLRQAGLGLTIVLDPTKWPKE